jgi:hypothetical protein
LNAIEHRVSIACPSDAVWAILADIPAWPTWTRTMSRACRVSGEGRGARFALKQPMQKEATWTVTEWEPGRSFTWERTDRQRRFVARHELIASDAATISLVRLRVEGMGTVMAAAARPVLSAAVAWENRALRARCEAMKGMRDSAALLMERRAKEIHQQYGDERKDHGTAH